MYNDNEIHGTCSAPLSPSYILKLLKAVLNLNSEDQMHKFEVKPQL